ncbi:unnamed protein product [Mytilus coruscus]|uniref:Uncharacterized protein n=1 Tax=Mytilus coruscus TaxID=42192 RepID=A0A6J8C0D9_MYTCO|nr:unnamed protein product [Mytilus coruscus]
MELPNELKALLVTLKLDSKEPEYKFSASSEQVSVQLTWIKAKEPGNLRLSLKKKKRPPSTRKRNANRFAQWMYTKTTVVPAVAQKQNTEAIVDHNRQTEATYTIVGKLLTPTKYRGEPVGVVINKDIVTCPYNPKKTCHRVIYYTSTKERGKRSRIYFDEGFDIDNPDLLTTTPHTSSLNLQSKEAIEAAILSERPNTPYQQQHRSRCRMKARRQADPNL